MFPSKLHEVICFSMSRKLRKQGMWQFLQMLFKMLLSPLDLFCLFSFWVARLPTFRFHLTEMVLAGLVASQCSAHFWIRWQLFRCRVWFSCVSACLFNFFVFWFPSSFSLYLNRHLRNRLTGWKSKMYYLRHRSEREKGTAKGWEIMSLLCLYFFLKKYMLTFIHSCPLKPHPRLPLPPTPQIILHYHNQTLSFSLNPYKNAMSKWNTYWSC